MSGLLRLLVVGLVVLAGGDGSAARAPAGSPVWERLGNGVGAWFERDVLEQVTAMSVRDTGLTSGSVSAYQAAFASASAGDVRYELGATTRTAYGAATVVVDSAVAPGNPRRDAVFSYDGAARLVSATLGETFDGATSQGSYAFAYAYDGLQNLVQREAVSVPTGAAAPRMASGAYEHGGTGYGPRQLAGVPSAGVTMSYDGAGRMVARTGGGFGAAMVYDASDRVRVVALGDDEVRHRYGPTGERNWTGWFEDDVLEREEYRFASGLALRNGRYELVVGLGGSRSLARISVPEVADATHEVTYMHPGVGPGAVTFTDKAGALVEERLHEPFGVALEGPGADYEQEPLGWNAKPVDPWTEWSDHGARWHATDLAHWLSPDPLLRGPDVELVSEFWRLSLYGFVAGNPVAYWDPDGRTWGDHMKFAFLDNDDLTTEARGNALGVAAGLLSVLAAPIVSTAKGACASNPAACTTAGVEVAQGVLETVTGINMPGPSPADLVQFGQRGLRATIGGIVEAGPKVAATTARASSRALGRALEAAGHARPPNSAAHHIVAGNAQAAAPARSVLHRFGIDINDPANGVFLPRNTMVPNPGGAAVHSTLHTRAYYETVNEVLGQATTRQEALDALRGLGQGLLGGGL